MADELTDSNHEAALRTSQGLCCQPFWLSLLSSFTIDRKNFYPQRLCSFLSAAGCHESVLWQNCCYLCKPDDLYSCDGIKRLKLQKLRNEAHDASINPLQEGKVAFSEALKEPFSTDTNHVPGVKDVETSDHILKKRKTGEQGCLPVFPKINMDWGLPDDECPQPPTVTSKEPLTSWDSYYKYMNIKPSSPIALLMHFPLTLYLGLWLSRESGNQKMPDKNLKIHYLGPREELAILEVFQQLYHLTPGRNSCMILRNSFLWHFL